LEVGGVSYDGPATGIFNTYMSEAPGHTHTNRGNVERLEGMTLIDQVQLNDLTGDLFAYKNAKYIITQNMIGNYRNIDIAPKEICKLNIGIDDTVRRIQFTNKPFHPVSMGWNWSSEKAFLYPNIVFNEVTNGIGGATEQIPAETVDVPTTPPITPPITIPPIVFPNLFAGPKTYTWPVILPVIGGIPGPFLVGKCTVLGIYAYCIDGTSVTFNIEERSIVGTTGVNLMSADLAAYHYQTGVESFAHPVLSGGRWLWLDLSNVVGPVTQFVVTLVVMAQ
jgi:hypothetical protein